MKLLITSDFHVGVGERHSNHRQDVLDSLSYVVDSAIKEQVNIFISAGDTLDKPSRVPTTCLITLSQELARLKDNQIKVYTILGNHDSHVTHSMMEVFQPIVKIIKRDNYKEISPINLSNIVDMVLLPYLYKDNTIPKFPPPSKTRIVVAHQATEGIGGSGSMALEKIREREYVLSLQDLQQLNATMLFCGHLHRHAEFSLGDTKVFFPGASCIITFGEANAGNGFYVIDTETMNVKYNIIPQRKWYNITGLPSEIESGAVYKVIIPQDMSRRVSDIQSEFTRMGSEVSLSVQRNQQPERVRIDNISDMKDEDRMKAYLEMKEVEDVDRYLKMHRMVIGGM